MAKKIIFILCTLLGVLAIEVWDDCIKSTQNSDESLEDSMVVVTYTNLLDSNSLKLEQDSIVRYGSEFSSDDLFYYYGHLNCGLYDYAYYSFILVNKFNDKRACGRMGYLVDVDSLQIKNDGLFAKMLRFYLLRGASMNDINSCNELKILYGEGILFPKDHRKSLYFENKSEKLEEIKWMQ